MLMLILLLPQRVLHVFDSSESNLSILHSLRLDLILHLILHLFMALCLVFNILHWRGQGKEKFQKHMLKAVLFDQVHKAQKSPFHNFVTCNILRNKSVTGVFC